jgi:uncharacterized protein (DUF924 family)
MSDADAILAYWFSKSMEDEAAVQACMDGWFKNGAASDDEIRARFSGDLERAVRGELDGWTETPRGHLALILVVDQFSRQIHRNTPKMFASDPIGLRLSLRALETGVNLQFNTVEQIFFTLPLAHTEDLVMQDRNVKEAEARLAAAKPPFVKAAEHSVKGARRHREVIAEFGRFPKRNAAIGRESTAKELEYLDYIKKNNLPL